MAIGNPIESHPVLQRHARKLRALGYVDVDTVAGALTGASARMADYLAEDVSASLQGVVGAFQAPGRFQLGVALDQIPAVQVAFAMAAPAAAPLPPSVNLIPNMPPIRDQANRGTCVAHAALAALENLRTRQGSYQDMSEQFLYWDCKQHDTVPTQPGTWLGVAIPLLQKDGCCREVTWAYNPNPIAGNEGQGPAPAPASLEAPTLRIANYQTLAPTSVVDMKRELVRSRCVPFSIPVFNSWYQNNAVVASGDIVLPFPGEAVVGGHAMCICGYLDDPAEEDIGGGRFILRNSWDSAWGTASVHGTGYGTIPYAYISRFGKEAYSIE
jgi:C1A family cysteine protease